MAARKEDDARDSETTLEEFLIACQKSLARAAASSSEAGKSDSEFAQGDRPVYVVDGIDIDLNAGIRLSSKGRGAPDFVTLDFESPTEQRSRVRFRVENRPLDILAGAKLELANLDPTGEELPLVRLRVWLVDDKGAPVPNHEATLHFARAGDKRLREKEQIAVKTDVVGRVDFYVDTKKADKNLKIIGVRTRSTVHVQGSGRGVGDDEFYVWATCKREPDWENIVEPVAPRPPVESALDAEGVPLELCSELIRLRIGGSDHG